MKTPHSSHFYALLTVSLWASVYISTKICLEYYTPFALGLLRYVLAAVILLSAAALKKTPPPQKKDIPLVILTGAMGFGIYTILFNLGARTITSATSSLIVSTSPIIVAVLSTLFLQERLRVAAWAAIALEFLGIIALTLGRGLVSVNHGIFWTLAAAFLFSVYQLLTRRLAQRYTPFAITTYCIIVAALMLLVFLPQALPQLSGAPFTPTAALIYLAVLPTALAYVWWAKALSLAKNTSQVTNYMFLTPFLTAILGYFILGERLDTTTVLGGLLIISGLALFSFFNRRQPEKTGEEPGLPQRGQEQEA